MRVDQALAVGRGDDQLDQLVDHRILDADELRLPGVSAAAEPQKSRCSLPGDSDWPKPLDDHVEVEVVDAVLVLRACRRCARSP